MSAPAQRISRSRRKTGAIRKPRGAKQAKTVPVIMPGDYDPMSALAYAMRLPICTAVHPVTRYECTRVIGHDDGDMKGEKQHPSSLHVGAGAGFIARETWW